MCRTIRAKLLSAVSVISGLVLVLAMFAMTQIDRVGSQGRAVLQDRLPMARCSQEARLAVANGQAYLDRVLILTDSNQLGDIRNLQGQFRKTILTFQMFSKAMIWGSESEAFSQSAGGLVLAEWRRQGLEGTLVVSQAPKTIRQHTGRASIYYGGFAKHVRSVMKQQRKLLRADLAQDAQARAEARAAIAESTQKVNRFQQLTDDELKEVVRHVDHYIDQTVQEIQRAQRYARTMLLVFFGAIFALSLGLGMLLTGAITRPLRQLQRAAAAIGKGDFTTPIQVQATGELGDLAAALRRMVKELQESIEREKRLAVSAATAEAEHQRAEEILKTQKALAKEVTQRAKAQEELQRRIGELQTLNDIMIGREERILELKAEVNEALKALGQSSRYSV